MSFSTLPLSYCTNVHPGRNVDEVLAGLRSYTAAARRELGDRIAAGLWLPASTVDELKRDSSRVERLAATLREGGLVCYTLNAFPYGDFHGERVKENVYLPDWTSQARLDYTIDCARILGQLMPEGTEGSLSTLPLGFKGMSGVEGREGETGGGEERFPWSGNPEDFTDRCIGSLLKLVRALDALHDESGQVIRLAIEPEPCCLLETTPEAVAFFRQLFEEADRRGLGEGARRHLGLCYDVCHQAVEFERVEDSIRKLNDAGIRINKVHVTCAIHVDQPAENPGALRELARYVEPRYLHQVFARRPDGSVARRIDLTPELCASPPETFLDSPAWRVHFHVPVHRESLGPLKTTREDLKAALKTIGALEYAPHLEVETYTWGVLPEGERRNSLTEGLVKELAATQTLIAGLRAHSA